MKVLAGGGCELYDVEQVVLRDRLNLGVLFAVPEGVTTIKDLLFYAWEKGVHIDFEVVEETPMPVRSRLAVTVIGPRVGPEAFGAVASAVADAGGNIDRIERLSRYPVVSYELTVTRGDAEEMRRRLMEVAVSHRVDVAVQSEGLSRRAKRLVVIDVDSTLIEDEIIELLAEERGVVDRVGAITAAAMRGEIDFEESLRSRVGQLEGLPEAALHRVWERVRLTPGARTFIRTLKRLGMKTAIVSGGFTFFTDRLAKELGIDHAHANRLEVVDGCLTGRLQGAIVDRGRKATLLLRVAEEEGVPVEQTVAIGDGANDLDMLSAAGLGIAFNAKPVVQAAADTTLSVPYLDAILFLLGIRRDEVEAQDQTRAFPVVEGLPPL
jgi:phosphoserine phosphatase